ncbi:serine/threonine-protein kinase [Sorangium sp. So ce429]
MIFPADADDSRAAASPGPRRGRDDATVTGPVPPAPPDATPDLGLDATGDSPRAPAAAPDDPSPVPPSLHARFEDFHLLGRGGMGVVYRAWDLRLGRRVAIKLVSSGAQIDGSFLREARSQARLRHENVCEVYEAGVADRVPFIVMRYIEGRSLQEARGDLTLEEKVRVTRTIAAALHEAHRLGLVHRDVKPSNILLERGEDGAYRPYLMDFGIARDVGESGLTLTGGALAGTPAYMAPEQAAGMVRSLDRRTDVYGLGATLHALLAGRPPFVGGAVMDVLRQVLEAEPPPLRTVDRDIPQDLEAVVLRCLEKEPGARYESARALGEDLQRFLDGDPVLARRASLGRRLARQARRHRAAVLGAAALLLAALVVAGLFVRSRRAAAEQATLARELGETVGETVKEMELFLRGAHGMPLHDVERERDVVRARLKAVEARMATAGALGRGPGEYALGRGLLALQEPRAALEHLREAERAGYRSPGLDYAAGAALSELYRRGLEETRRIHDKAQREARVAALEAEYRAPAAAHLRAALGGAIEAPAYVEGLLALAEGRHDEALEKARAAFAEAPWLHEAKKLEGDVLFAMGSRYRHDAAFDFDKMKAHFDRAAEAYRIAADHGRSDPSVYAGECELWTQTMNAAGKRRDSMRPSFERAREACGRALAASPRSPEAHVKLAWVHSSFAWWVASRMPPGEDAGAVLREATARAEEALATSPDDAMARYVAAAVFRARAYHADLTGREQGEALERAIQGYEAALQREPDFAWALHELCGVLAERGRYESLRGLDPTGSLERARARCDSVLALDPGFASARTSRLITGVYEAEHLARAGRSPEEVVQRTHGVIDAIRQKDPSWTGAPYWRLWLDHTLALYALDAGADPGPAFARVQASAREMAPGVAGYPESLRAMLAMLEARVRMARGEDPSPAIQVVRETLDRSLSETPWDVWDRVQRAEAELLAFRWGAQRRRPDAARLDAALVPLRPLLLGEPLADPPLYAVLAEIHEARAALRTVGRRQDGPDDIAEGLRHAGAALGLNPRYDRALAAQGALFRLRAAAAPDAAARRQETLREVAALEAAIHANPLRARTLGARLAEARRLTGETPALAP